jgi:hypothetical protein
MAHEPPRRQRPCFSAFQTRNDFFGRTDKSETARQIIGRTQRENTHWNAGVDESRGYFDNRAIAAGGKNEIGGFFRAFL